MFTLSSYRYDCLRLHFDLLRLVGLMILRSFEFIEVLSLFWVQLQDGNHAVPSIFPVLLTLKASAAL